MALGTLGTTATTSLNCLHAWSEGLPDSEIAAIAQSIVGDNRFAAVLGGGPSGPTGIIATGTTNATTAISSLLAVAGAGLPTIQPGYLVIGADIPPGTFVSALTSTTALVLSQAATGSNAAEPLAFVPPPDRPMLSRVGQLVVPNRGTLNLRPGDIVAIDPITDWPILVSAAAISTTGSVWNLV